MGNSKKKIIILMGMFLTIIFTGSATYAWFKWRTSVEQTVNINLTATSVITFVGGQHLYGYLDPAYVYSDGTKKDIKIISELPGSTFNLYMKINKLPVELKETFFLWAIYKGEEYIDGGNFSTYNVNDNITLLLNREIPTESYDTYSLYLWLDAEEDLDSSIANKIVDVTLYATGDSGSVNEIS